MTTEAYGDIPNADEAAETAYVQGRDWLDEIHARFEDFKSGSELFFDGSGFVAELTGGDQ